MFTRLSLTVFCVSAFCAIALSGTVALATPEDGTCILKCQPSPRNREAVRKAIYTKVLNLIEPRYDNPKVTVGMKVFQVNPDSYEMDLDQALDGLDLENSGNPAGIGFSVSGFSQLGLNESCEYSYLVTINTRGNDKDTGQFLQVKTQSYISILGQGDGKFSCN